MANLSTDKSAVTTFSVIGLSYRKADASIRGYFSVTEETQQAILNEAVATGIATLTIISTCNRTELYGFVTHPNQLISLLCKYTRGDETVFREVAYSYTCLLYTSPSPRDLSTSRMPSSA